MSVQTQAIVDSRLMTRNLDIHQILVLNRERETKMMESAAQASSDLPPPTVGILTQTIVRSPVIRSIIPARIRHQSKNDVIYVYENYVVVKELSGGERIKDVAFSEVVLEDVITISDFDSTIRAARIIGLPRQGQIPCYPGIYWDPINVSQRPGTPPEIKPEILHDHQMAPQILVLCLESRMLVFLFAYYDVQENVHFRSRNWPLPPKPSFLEELGEHLAVDPR